MFRRIRPEGHPPSLSLAAIRYPVAEVEGQLVWADRLDQTDKRDQGAGCIVCHGVVRLHVGGDLRPHFAHDSAGACADDETALHAATIRVIRDGILAAADQKRPFPLALPCRSCVAEREADLARVAHHAAINQELAKGVRPHLLMLSASGRPLYVIEVVTSDRPRREALQLYQELGLPCIRVWPTWGALSGFCDGFRATFCRARPDQRGCFDVVDRCRFPRHVPETEATCRRCPNEALWVSVEVSVSRCWKCSASQRILDIYARAGGEMVLVAAGCDDLVGVADVAAARAVNMRWTHSKRAECSYLMHFCAHCRATSGDNFIYGSVGSDNPIPLTTEPVWQMTVCADGHWEKVSEGPWSPGTAVGRATGHWAGRRNGRTIREGTIRRTIPGMPERRGLHDHGADRKQRTSNHPPRDGRRPVTCRRSAGVWGGRRAEGGANAVM